MWIQIYWLEKWQFYEIRWMLVIRVRRFFELRANTFISMGIDASDLNLLNFILKYSSFSVLAVSNLVLICYFSSWSGCGFNKLLIAWLGWYFLMKYVWSIVIWAVSFFCFLFNFSILVFNECIYRFNFFILSVRFIIKFLQTGRWCCCQGQFVSHKMA